MVKKVQLSEYFFRKLNKGENIELELKEAINDSNFVNSGMLEIWCGLIRHEKYELFDWLIKNNIHPNEKSEIMEQLIAAYDTSSLYKHFSPDRKNHVEKMINLVLPILENTEEGKKSIVRDIEKYFGYYGSVIVNINSYDLIEKIYSKHEDINRLYYLESVNQLKFYNTFDKPLFELKVVQNNTLPILEKIVNTKYWNQLKKIKFTNPINQENWLDFCKKFKSMHKLNDKLEEKENPVLIKKPKI